MAKEDIVDSFYRLNIDLDGTGTDLMSLDASMFVAHIISLESVYRYVWSALR